MWKAFVELAELGWLESAQMPRLVAVQAEGCAPEGAATLAALEKLIQQGWVKAEERIVLFNTGSV